MIEPLPGDERLPSGSVTADRPGPADPAQRHVLLIRHGETEWSRTHRHTGSTDIALTPRGEQDARALSGIGRRLGLTDPYVFASPRRRARRTAELAGLAADEIDPIFAEWDYGDYEGRTRAQIRADDDPDWTIWTSGAPHGESVAEMTERVDAAVGLVERQLAATDVIVVSHGHFSRAFACRFLGWPIRLGADIDLRPAGVALLREAGGERLLSALVGPEGAATVGYSS